ncbi:MAG: alpha/beta fold hydrolase [Bacteroides sp.]|nr:alpha/beta fold hydrolase [Bacteroides sp.]
MKRVASALVLATAGVINLSASSAVNISDFSDLAPYVYPSNRAKSVPAPYFTADGQSYLQLSPDGKRVVKYDIRNGAETETVMDVTHTRQATIDRIESFTLSPDGSKLLIATATEPIYRRSTQAVFYVYELRTRILTPLSDEHKPQRAPLFSPDGRMVAFVGTDNNIYLSKLDFGTEVAVTTDGAVNRVINGVPDWVYEEEFATSRSMSWAPDCMTLCYLKYNETDVPTYTFPMYEGTCNPMTQYALYPGSFTYKYPVAGQPNSVVTVHSYDVDNRKTKNVTLPGNDIEYIPRIAYAADGSGRLLVTTLNRDQNYMEIFSVNPKSGVSKSIFTEQSEAWICPDTYENMTLMPKGMIILSARTGYEHAYMYSYEGQLVKTLTSGEYDVKQFYGTDVKGNYYFQSTSTGPVNRVITRVDAKGVSKNLTPATGIASAWFAPTMDYYAVTYSNSTTPPVCTLYSAPADKKVRVLEDNAGLAEKYASAPKPEFITITTSEGVTMNAAIYRPADTGASRRYPVIIDQYSGPGSQQVLNRWSVDWMQYAAMNGYVVITVDPRGTGGRGRAWETIVYKNLGHYEAIDLRGAARWAATLPYVDPDRIGIAGWSYGGYQTLMSVSDKSSPFACAVAIAPVTDWRFYDTIYSERYMLTPQQNAQGYMESAPLNHVADVNIPMLMMHGTADDNVHLMNTMQYVSVMQSLGRFCDLWLYPNMNHSINGCNSRLNVYSKMLDYFNKNL